MILHIKFRTILLVSFSMMIGAVSVVEASKIRARGYTPADIAALFEYCEAEIPRSQSCELVVVPPTGVQ